LKTAVIQVVIPTYKVGLFKFLSEEHDIDFYVGDKNNAAVAPNATNLDFVKGKLKNKFIRFMGIDWLIQTGFPIKTMNNYDLIIIPISVPFFLNYKILLMSKLLGFKVGMYGMGINFQKKNSSQTSFLEKIRKLLYVNTSFAIVYTESIKDTLISKHGGDSKKLFVAPNTLDVHKIDAQIFDISITKKKLGIMDDQIVITFAGRLSSQKKPELLISVLEILHKKKLDVILLFIGDGELASDLKAISKEKKNIKFLGQLSEEETTDILKASDFSVMPGMSGLAIVHSFICKALYITVESNLHSPEIEYLKHGVNGLIIEPNEISLAETIEYFIKNPIKKNTIEEAAYNFAKNNLSLDYQVNGFMQAIKSIGENENSTI
jgi:glycosyltransferase involved in cell wall biosynthesis